MPLLIIPALATIISAVASTVNSTVNSTANYFYNFKIGFININFKVPEVSDQLYSDVFECFSVFFQ